MTVRFTTRLRSLIINLAPRANNRVYAGSTRGFSFAVVDGSNNRIVTGAHDGDVVIGTNEATNHEQ